MEINVLFASKLDIIAENVQIKNLLEYRNRLDVKSPKTFSHWM